MKPIKLRLVNFLSFEDETIDIPNMSTAIMGFNADGGGDSNGSGKSVIFDGIVYALYGVTLRNISIADIFRRGTSECSVEFHFEQDGMEYHVLRTRDANASKVSLVANGQSIGKSGQAGTQDIINSVLGMNAKTFIAVATFGCDTLRFASATDKEQKELLERLLDIGIYDEALVRVRTSIRDIESEIKGLDISIQNIKAEEARQRSINTQIQSELEVAESVYQTWESEVKTRLEGAKSGLAIFSGTVGVFLEQQSKLVEPKKAEDFSSGKNRIVQEIETKIYRAQSDLNSLNNEHARLESELSLNQKLIGTPCRLCGRNLTEKELNNIIEKLAESTIAAEDRIETLKKEVFGLTERLVSARKEAESASSDYAAGMADWSRWHYEYIKISDKINSARRDETIARNNVSTIENELQNGGPRRNIYELRTRISLGTAEVERKRETIGKQMKEIDAKREELSYLKFWEVGFGYGGIRSMILDDVAAQLTDAANKYLQILTNGIINIRISTQSQTASGELREKFAVQVYNQYGAGAFEGNSGGEKQRIEISIALALFELAQSRASKPVGFALYDEIFERLDATGCEAVMRILATNKTGNVFVISHNPYMLQHFTNVIKIEKREGISKVIRTSLCEKSKPQSESTPKATQSPRARKRRGVAGNPEKVVELPNETGISSSR